jgi:hypothetical protein
MNQTMILFGLVATIASLMVVIGLRKRRGQATAEDVMERMGRFATREEMLSAGDADPKASERLAEGVEQAFKGRKVATRSAVLMARADLKLTVGEFLILRAGGAINSSISWAIRSR